MNIADTSSDPVSNSFETNSPSPLPPSASGLVLSDGSKLNSEAIAWSLKAYGGFRDIQSTESASEVVAAIKAQRPAVVLLGERIVTEGTREILSELAVRMGETHVAVFGDELTDRQLDLVAHNRVTGLLSRKESMRNLNEQLMRIASGAPVLSSFLQERVQLSRDGQFRCLASAHLKKLTDRQWDVLLRIAEGRRVSEVATDLSISAKAVESHKYRIMKTIGASDRVGLCRWAIREGLIDA